MSKIDTVRREMMDALKAKNMERKSALSVLLSELKAKWIDKRADLTEEEENAIILKEIKQAEETMRSAPPDRTELIEDCKARILIYSEFVPKMMGEEEITQKILEVFADLGLSAPTGKDKGAIMKKLMPLVKGKADGSLVNRLLSGMLH